jgi:hypothetical protein
VGMASTSPCRQVLLAFPADFSLAGAAAGWTVPGALAAGAHYLGAKGTE